MIENPRSIARIDLPDFSVVHCRMPRWEVGEYRSFSQAGSVGLSFTGQRCVTAVGGRTRDDVIQPRSLVVTGAAPVDWLRVADPSEFIEITANQPLRHSIAEELGIPHAADLELLRRVGDSVTWSIAAHLRVLCRRNLAHRVGLATEHLVRLFYGRIFLECFGGKATVKGVGALDRRRLDRVTEYIDTHLAADLRLNSLADVAALSPFHFLRSFRKATGCTPHHYVAMKRAELARERLALGHPAKIVAQQLKYSDQRRLQAALQTDLGA